MHGICQYPSCSKTAAYNVEGELERAYCKAHCQEIFPGREVSNLAGKRCQASSGCRAQAVWGEKQENGKVQAQACVEHKTPGMLRAGARYCITEGCHVRAACGFPVEKPVAETCSRHRRPGMVDLRTLRKQRTTGQAGTSRSDEDSERSSDEQRSCSSSPVPVFARESRKRGRGAMGAEDQGSGKQENEDLEAYLKRQRPPLPVALERPRLPQPVLTEPPKPRTDKDGAATAAGDKRRAATAPSPPYGLFTGSGGISSSSDGAAMLLAAAAAVHDDPTARSSGLGVFAEIRPGTGSVQLGGSQASPRRGRPNTTAVLQEAARVAVTCVKLHYDGLVGGVSSACCIPRLGSCPLDVTLHLPPHCQHHDDHTQALTTASMACGALSAICQAPLDDTVCVLGEVSLGGELLPLAAGTDLGALLHEAGSSIHTYILPHGSTQGLEERLPQGARVYRVSTLHALVKDVFRQQHTNNTRDTEESAVPSKVGEYACAWSSVPTLQQVEVAATPGTGQVHMTGRLSLPTLNCLGGALVWLRDNLSQVFDRLRLVRGRRVEARLDLSKMERLPSGQHPHHRFDLHLHLPSLHTHKYESWHGPAAVLALVSLVTGLPLPRGLALHAGLTSHGTLEVPSSPSSMAELEEGVCVAMDHGMRMLLVPATVEDLFKPRFPEDGPIKVVGVWTMLDAIQVAFGPYASEEMVPHDPQPEAPRSTALPYERHPPPPGGRSPSSSSGLPHPPANRAPYPTHPLPPSHPSSHHSRASHERRRPSPSPPACHSPKALRFSSPLPPPSRQPHAPSDEESRPVSSSSCVTAPLRDERRPEPLYLEEDSPPFCYSSASSACGSTDAGLPFLPEPEELLVRMRGPWGTQTRPSVPRPALTTQPEHQ